jgi:hypothetical protein
VDISYKEDPERKLNNIQAITISTKDPKLQTENEIRSFSTDASGSRSPSPSQGTIPLGKQRTMDATGNPAKGLQPEVELIPNEVAGADQGHMLAFRVGSQAWATIQPVSKIEQNPYHRGHLADMD